VTLRHNDNSFTAERAEHTESACVLSVPSVVKTHRCASRTGSLARAQFRERRLSRRATC